MINHPWKYKISLMQKSVGLLPTKPKLKDLLSVKLEFRD